jgi:acetyl-CoA synthetase
VRVIDEQGNERPRGELGEIAVCRTDVHGAPNPVFFVEYWNNPQATQDKFVDEWGLTGDQGRMDEDGYVWYQGRTDDVIKSAGYRIGPAEIEDCLLKHPAVGTAAVIGVPDEERGARIKACVVLRAGVSGSAALAEEIRAHVRARLAPYQCPKEIEFIDALPMTTTGKIQRRVLRERGRTPTSGEAVKE